MPVRSSNVACAAVGGCTIRTIATCDGCGQWFCLSHINEHRAELDRTMASVIKEHDDIKSSLDRYEQNGGPCQLLKPIHNWEQDAIRKIRKRANDLRLEITKFAETHYANFQKRFQNLSMEIKEFQNYNDFVEADLHRWKQAIDELRLNFVSPVIADIDDQKDGVLVQDITINLVKKTTNETFVEIYDNQGRIEENGQVVIHNNSRQFVEIRGKNEYKTGCHHVRLCLEDITGDWAFLGINSKLFPLQNQSHTRQSSFGWSSDGRAWSNGLCIESINGPPIDMRNTDIISFYFDCDEFRIIMVNERTDMKHEMPVVTDQCPFPWQLHLILSEPNNRVRILSN